MKKILKILALSFLLSLFLSGLSQAQTLTYPLYQDQLAKGGWGTYLWDTITEDLAVTNPVYAGSYSIGITPGRGWTAWHFWNNDPLDTSSYSYFSFAARGTDPNVWWEVQFLNKNTESISANTYKFQPSTDWKIHTINLNEFDAGYQEIYGVRFWYVEKNVSSSTLYLDEVGFGGTAPTPTALPAPAAVNLSLSVNASQIINPFDKKMLGAAMVNWEHSWGRPFPNEVPGLVQAFREAGIGAIRYAGGLWSNYVGFDRTAQRNPNTEWSPSSQLASLYGYKTSEIYYFHYGTDEMASLNAFADAIGADVIIQVNIGDAVDPNMWADMVRWANIEQGYNFKYWELGNEFDIDTQLGVTPEMYRDRVKLYVDAMKAVDPTIKILGGVPGSAHDGPRQGWSDSVTDMSHYLTLTAPAVSASGKQVDGLSYHWYQQSNSTSNEDLLRWNWPDVATNSWRNSYSRIWSQIAPSRVQNEILNPYPNMIQGITELNFDSSDYENVRNGNHLNALWFADILGRLAYNGLDYMTIYEGYGIQGYAFIYPDNGDNPTSLFLRPNYYTFFMYNRYFGDRMVETSTTFPNYPTVGSLWASTDSADPGKLKLMAVNLSPDVQNVSISIQGFTSQTAQVYKLVSSNPTSSTSTSNQDSSNTRINGIKLNANNVAQSASTIVPQTISVAGNQINYALEPYSITAFVVGGTPPNLPFKTRLPIVMWK